MKLLFFSSYFYPYTSGLTTYPLKILNYLAKKNNVTILTFIYDKKLKPEEKIGQLKIIRIPFCFKISKGFISPQSIGYFIKETKKNDLVILNLPNFEGLPLAIIGKFFGKKIISIFHCHVDLGDDLISKIINFFLSLSVFFQFLLSDIVVGYTKDYVSNLWLGKIFKKKILTILPPVEKPPVDKQLLAKYLKEKNNFLWIGFAGRIAKEKGLEYLIEALLRLKKTYSKIKLILAGPYGKQVAGENKYFRKIVNLLNQSKMNYQFLGNLHGKSLGSFYKAIDVLVLPSINNTEAFGMVQVEAMLLGTPVVVTNLVGVRIPIRLTKMGLIVPSKNSDKLAKAIEKIIKNKNKYTNHQLIANCQNIFKSQKTYQFYEKIFEKNEKI